MSDGLMHKKHGQIYLSGSGIGGSAITFFSCLTVLEY